MAKGKRVKKSSKSKYDNLFDNHVDSQEEKRKVGWIFCLLMSIFFGYLGIDRFIMGHIGTGLLKLCTLGGCGIWWLIDIILIASKYNAENVEWIDNLR